MPLRKLKVWSWRVKQLFADFNGVFKEAFGHVSPPPHAGGLRCPLIHITRFEGGFTEPVRPMDMKTKTTFHCDFFGLYFCKSSQKNQNHKPNFGGDWPRVFHFKVLYLTNWVIDLVESKFGSGIHHLICTVSFAKWDNWIHLRQNESLSVCEKRASETGFPYQFFGANQRKVDVKILSWTQCAISKDWRDWHILAGGNERNV